MSASARLLAGALAALSTLLACTGPRSVLHSPEATPKGSWRVGGSMDANLPTQTSEALYGGLEGGVRALHDRVAESDSAVPITADSLNDLTRALIAYSLDPIGMSPSLWLRYGLWHRVDAGYRYAGGVHAFDARFQFLGPQGAGSGWRGSLAAQYSSQDYELPSLLSKLQSVLRYEFKRKDLLFPLVLGKPFGADGRYGDFGLGAAYNLSFIEYGSEILKLVEKADSAAARPFEDLQGERTVHALGGFANLRAGYRHVFLLASFAAYRQDYGTFKLFGGERTSLSGWTFAPSFGMELRF